ncbi:MAG: spherulation-specific family 4 protein [Planctomycetota bacterium]
MAVTLLHTSLSIACGQGIRGNVKFPDVSESQLPSCRIFVCQRNTLLQSTITDEDGAFELKNTEEGPFDIVFLSDSMTPLVFKSIQRFDGEIDVELTPIVRWLPFSSDSRSYEESKKRLDRAILDAEDVFPKTEDFQKVLNEFKVEANRRLSCSIIVPAYFYPEAPVAGQGEWKEMVAFLRDCKQSGIEVVVILNIWNGSGKVEPTTGEAGKLDKNYFTLAEGLKKLEVPWVGYLAGRYGGDRRITLEEDAKHWADNYPGIHGFFVDELPESADKAERFRRFCQFARDQLGIREPILIGNPGTECDRVYGEPGMFDWLCLSENKDEIEFAPPLWARSDNDVRTGQIVYGLDSVDSVEPILNNLASVGGSFVYLSDQDPRVETLWTRLPQKEYRSVLGRLLRDWNRAARQR